MPVPTTKLIVPTRRSRAEMLNHHVNHIDDVMPGHHIAS
jgi:hypothetical protein